MVKPAHSDRVSSSARLWQYVQRHRVKSTVTQVLTVRGGGAQHRILSEHATLSSLGTGRSIAHTGGGNWTSVAVLLQLRWSARTIPAWSVDTVSTRPDGGKGRLVRRTNQSKTRDPSATARRASQSCPSLTRGAAADRHCSAPAVTVGQLARSRPGPPAQSRLDWMGMDGRMIRSTNRV